MHHSRTLGRKHQALTMSTMESIEIDSDFKAKSASESTPSREVSSGSDDIKEKDKIDEGSNGVSRKDSTIFSVVLIVCLACFIIQITAMAIEKSAAVIVGAIFGTLWAPVVLVRQRQLKKMQSLREVHNKIREEVNKLQGENEILEGNIDELDTQVEGLEHVEKQVKDITERQGYNVNNLILMVKENGSILKDIKKLVKADFRQQILTTVLRSDRDCDMTIQDKEIDMLLLRLKHQRGIVINEVKFRDALVSKEGCISAIMSFLRETEDQDDIEDKNAIISVDVDEICNAKS